MVPVSTFVTLSFSSNRGNKWMFNWTDRQGRKFWKGRISLKKKKEKLRDKKKGRRKRNKEEEEGSGEKSDDEKDLESNQSVHYWSLNGGQLNGNYNWSTNCFLLLQQGKRRIRKNKKEEEKKDTEREKERDGKKEEEDGERCQELINTHCATSFFLLFFYILSFLFLYNFSP